MNQQEPDFWLSATQAREKLESQIQDRSDICFVDIGYPQNSDLKSEEANEQISLRIHVCANSAAIPEDTFPDQVNGIPVVITSKSLTR